MSAESDPATWKSILDYLWAVVLIPLKMLWTKADNAASKEELKDGIESSQDALTRALMSVEKSNDNWRKVTGELYANAESDRMQWHANFSKMQDTIHGVHTELLREIGNLKHGPSDHR